MGAFCHGGLDGVGLLANWPGMNHQQSGCELTSLDPGTGSTVSHANRETWPNDYQLCSQSVTVMCHNIILSLFLRYGNPYGLMLLNFNDMESIN